MRDENTLAELDQDRKTGWICGIEYQQKRDNHREKVLAQLRWDTEYLEQAFDESGFFVAVSLIPTMVILFARPIPQTDQTTDQKAINIYQMALTLMLNDWIEHQIDLELGA